MLNKHIIIGNVGNIDDMRHAGNDTPVVNMSVATKETWSKDGQTHESTQWHTVVCWGKLAEIVDKYVDKGERLAVIGSHKYDTWEDDDGNKRKTSKIRASEVKFLGATSSSEDGDFEEHDDDFDQSFDDDDIPF